MSDNIQRPATPSLPLSPVQYDRAWMDQYTNVFRLFFNRLVRTVRELCDRVEAPQVIKFEGLASAPSSPEAGWVYYDTTTNKLRCYNGTTWNDLF